VTVGPAHKKSEAERKYDPATKRGLEKKNSGESSTDPRENGGGILIG